jgi:hypothetical protein
LSSNCLLCRFNLDVAQRIETPAYTTGICERICKACIFDETFGVKSAFNMEAFVAALHAVAMEFHLFVERRSGHWVK